MAVRRAVSSGLLTYLRWLRLCRLILLVRKRVARQASAKLRSINLGPGGRMLRNSLLRVALTQWGGVSALLLALVPFPVQAPEPLVRGLDHIPVVVRDLDRAEADFRALGFVLKPGRLHGDGIRNGHVKFPDGTEIELITATTANDELASEYLARMKSGEGPVYFGLYAPDREAVAKRLTEAGTPAQDESGSFTFPATSALHPLFLGQRNKTSTDKPEYFAHRNGATRLSALWVRDSPELRQALTALGVALTPTGSCGPPGVAAEIRASLPEGDLYLVRPGSASVIAARVEVRGLSALKAVLDEAKVQTKIDKRCGREAVWVAPAVAHGIWLGFAEAEGTAPTEAASHPR
ncbi:VOC family protein [Acidobacteria bacterium AB60]|nr:VOC family protein [Acidobacteria bacterium AB60]